MASRWYTDFKELKLDKPAAYKPASAGSKGAQGRPQDSDPGYRPAGKSHAGMNGKTKFSDIKVAVVENYDGQEKDTTRYAR